MAYSAFSVAFLNIFVAHDAGLFKKQALDVELIQMAGPLPIAALSAGEIDYLTGYIYHGFGRGRSGRAVKRSHRHHEETAFLHRIGAQPPETRGSSRQEVRR